jgi:hypothetical protein
VCFFVFAREAMGATCIRHSLRPLISEGQCLARLGRFLCRENAGVHPRFGCLKTESKNCHVAAA